jgi:Cdc6-like AAA superfamily ATPase
VALGRPFKGLFQRKTERRAPSPAPTAPSGVSLSEIFQQTARKPDSYSSSKLPRFHSTAGDQLNTARSDRFAQVRQRLRNAFTPSQPVTDRRFFAGRKEVLSHMIGALEDQRRHLVLYGERGIGKTSLLHILADAAREARYIVVYWSCGAASNFDETFRAAAAEIPLLFHSGYSPTTSEAETGCTLADLLPERVSPRIFGELCAKITGTRVLIILDEFDRCESSEFRREIAELIKILSDRSVRVELVIAGVAADLAELVEHIPSIRRNIQTFKVPLMSTDEILEMVEAGTRTTGVNFERDAQAYVVSAACGSPYLASLICHHAALAAIDNRRAEVNSEDVATGVAHAAAELRDRVPRALLNRVDRLIDKGAGRPLAILARSALSSGGEFTDARIAEAAATSAEAALCKRLNHEIASDGDLITTQEINGERRYRFAEEGLPPYLWLLHAAEGDPEQRAVPGLRPTATVG